MIDDSAVLESMSEKNDYPYEVNMKNLLMKFIAIIVTRCSHSIYITVQEAYH